EIGSQAAFYRGYLPDDRSLVPVTVLLSTTLALWLLVYLVAAIAAAHQDADIGRVASVTFICPPANSSIPGDISAVTFPRSCVTEDNLGYVMPNSHLKATRDATTSVVCIVAITFKARSESGIEPPRHQLDSTRYLKLQTEICGCSSEIQV